MNPHSARQRLQFFLALLLFSSAAPGAGSGPIRQVHERLILRVSPDTIIPGSLTVSPDNARLAYVTPKGRQAQIVIDGVPGQTYDFVNLHAMSFSPDGKRFAFCAGYSDHKFLVVDGVPGVHRSRVEESDASCRVLFSHDSMRVAYVSKKGFRNEFVVLDGKEGESYPGVGDVRFIPTTQKLYYRAYRNNQKLLVMEGQSARAMPFASFFLPVFSPNGRRMAYVKLTDWETKEETTSREQVVLDDRPGKVYRRIPYASLVFSPDSLSLAYFAYDVDRKCMLVVNGNESRKLYDGCDRSPVFSPNGRRIAYWAERDGKWHVVVDGKEIGVYERTGDIVFSPDSRRLAFVAGREKDWRVVVDGAEGKPYPIVSHPIFSPDSRYLVYKAGEEKRRLGDDERFFVVVDGQEGRPYGGLFGAGPVRFTASDSFRYIVRRDTSFYLVEERLLPAQ